MEISGSGSLQSFGLQSGTLDSYRQTVSNARSGFGNFEENLRRAQNSGNIEQKVDGALSETDTDDKLYNLCLELETFLVKNLLTGMRNTVQKSGLIDEGFAGKMYEDMLWDEYAKDYTKNAGFGLADQAYQQLKRLK